MTDHKHSHASGQGHGHEHPHEHGAHAHSHGAVDPTILTTERGIWAVKWSFVGLFVTAAFQLFVVFISGSVALLADTIHNIGDAATAIPLWIAFRAARWKPNTRFTYGYGRVEDLAGIVIVLVILFSAVVAGRESVVRFLHPKSVEYLWAIVVASVVGCIGNEAVAQFRIKIGKEIGSAALVADGHHARVDGLTSLAVLLGAVGVWLGYPLADPAVGLLITLAILRIVWQSGKSIFARVLDGVDPAIVGEIRETVSRTPGVRAASEVRVRWLGHRLHAELNIAVSPELSVKEGHDIAKEARHNLLHHLRYLSNVTVHVDPVTASGEAYHGFDGHEHDQLPPHSH
jgi:cation diffusion facilitator family transporter